METNLESKTIEQSLAEADELIRQINSDALTGMREEHRLRFEIHARKLKKIKSKVQGNTARKGAPERDSGSEGMHEAILDIVKAMQGLKDYLS
jgi:hypothetical protein